MQFLPSRMKAGLARFAPLALAPLLLAAPARADSIVPTFFGPGVQAPDFAAICGTAGTCYYGQETFRGWSGGAFTSNFGTGPTTFTDANRITGAYSGGFVNVAANQYGGYQGTEPYPAVFAYSTPANYSIKFDATGLPGANYFGLWISALDGGNDLQILRGGQVLYDFTPQAMLDLIERDAAFYGNPTAPFLGQNRGEAYAYVNFFDRDGYFDEVRFSQNPATGSAGFESTNHAVAYAGDLHVVGTPVPEPATLALLGVGLAGLVAVRRRRTA